MSTDLRAALFATLLGMATLLPTGPAVLAQEAATAPARAQQPQAAPPAQGQTPEARGRDRQGAGEARPAAADSADLPPASTTTHTVGGVAFTATAGAIRLVDERGTLLAEIAHTTYRLPDADPRRRPVTFLVNGGPGASSAWLQFGAAGPWRLDHDTAATAPSTAPILIDNPQTWLPFTDLVFLDPAGTGYSRIVAPGDDTRRTFYSVGGDIDMLAAAIRRWTEENRREISPKFFVGESYGGFRGPLLARELAKDHGIGLAGLVLVSPVLDFRTRDGGNPIARAATLPSMVAAARTLDPALGDPADLASVEDYAAGEYLRDLLRGPRDEAARNRLATTLSRLTGLDAGLLDRNGGRLDTGTFLKEIGRRAGLKASPYDATSFGIDPTPFTEWSRGPDPVLDGLKTPLTAAARELYAGRLQWSPRRRYEVLANPVNRQWDWGRSLNMPESASELAEALAADPQLRVLIVHGRADLVTPYYASRLVIDQLSVPGMDARVALEVYPGGHMFYFDASARTRFREAGRTLIETVLAARQDR